MEKIDIVYEDNHIIAVNKPAGIAVQAAEKGERDLLERVKKYIKERDNKPGNVFLGLVHRIDRPVSGIVIFAKTSKGASRLSEQMRDGKIYKEYEAVVHGRMPEHKGRLVNYLSKLKQNKGYKAVVVKSGGDKAVLEYEVKTDDDKYSTLSIVLDTGRFHQIRAQLAETGHAIVGDTLYGSNEKLEHNAIMLRAVKCAFNHVITGERIKLEIKGFA